VRARKSSVSVSGGREMGGHQRGHPALRREVEVVSTQKARTAKSDVNKGGGGS